MTYQKLVAESISSNYEVLIVSLLKSVSFLSALHAPNYRRSASQIANKTLHIIPSSFYLCDLIDY